MGEPHPSGRVRDASRCGGVVHEIHRHTSHFTVVGNHLAQHKDLSCTAMGVAVHIQSLPPGARIDIKTLARDRTEGTARIAAVLRESERHGYLRRERTRIAGGRIVTRTVYCDKPGSAARREAAATAEVVPFAREPGSGSGPGPGSSSQPPHPQPHGENAPEGPARAVAADSALVPVPAVGGMPAASRPRQARKGKRRERKPLPPVPQPLFSPPEPVERAVELLTGLRRYAPEFAFSAGDVEHLTPGVVAWLEREATSGTVRRALLRGLPEEGLRRPAAFVAYRLDADLPAPPPPPRPVTAAEPPPVRHPLRNCEECDRGCRGPDPHRCRSRATAGGRPVAPRQAVTLTVPAGRPGRRMRLGSFSS